MGKNRFGSFLPISSDPSPGHPGASEDPEEEDEASALSASRACSASSVPRVPTKPLGFQKELPSCQAGVPNQQPRSRPAHEIHFKFRFPLINPPQIIRFARPTLFFSSVPIPFEPNIQGPSQPPSPFASSMDLRIVVADPRRTSRARWGRSQAPILASARRRSV